MSFDPRIIFNARRERISEAPCYTYDSLGKSQIRLLKLLPGKREDDFQCELKQTSLERAPKYLALSYAWGKNDRNCPIKINRAYQTWSEFKVTPNLLGALIRLRHLTETRYLWVDQICIAQDDDKEKNEQVELMGLIYERAEKTVAWLGDSDNDTPLLREICEGLTPWELVLGDVSQMHLRDQIAVRNLVVRDETGGGLSTRRRDAVVGFLDRAWFRRAWVYQEAIVSKEVEVYCGQFCVSFDVLARAVLAVYYLTKIEKDGIWCKKIKKSKGFGPLRAIWYDRDQYHKSNLRQPLDFLHVLWRARKYLEAAKPEDMVYSFKAFDDLSASHKIKANYEISPQQTYTILARSMIMSRKSLEIFQCVVHTQRATIEEQTSNKSPDLPSWVPDWSNRRFLSGAPILCPGLCHSFDACKGKQHDWVDSQNSNVLLVKGHIIEVIYRIIEHDCKDNTYFKDNLQQSLNLHSFTTLLDTELNRSALELDRSAATQKNGLTNRILGRDPRLHPRRTYESTEATALRTLLADGSFGLAQPIERQRSMGTVEAEHSLSELLRVYHAEGNHTFSPNVKKDAIIYRYMRDKGTVAEGKKPFLTYHLDIGLGYSNFRKGDLVVVLYGSKAPCVLRRKSHQSKEYRLMGQCYLDGWMYGTNPRKYKWWEKEPKVFALV